AVDQSMAPAQNVTLEPPLHRVLAKHLHNSTLCREVPTVVIFGEVLAEPDLLTNFIDGLELVGLCFVRPNHPDAFHVLPLYCSEQLPEDCTAARQGFAGFLDFNASAAEVGHIKWPA